MVLASDTTPLQIPLMLNFFFLLYVQTKPLPPTSNEPYVSFISFVLGNVRYRLND